MSTRLKALYNGLPVPLRTLLRRSGLPYAAGYYAGYREMGGSHRFAGRLLDLHEAYRNADGEAQRRELVRDFDAILDALVLPNGVKKTSYANRQSRALEHFLAGSHRPQDGTLLRVLDLPCSSGVTSLASYDRLSERYPVQDYVLSDLSFEMRYDPEQGCIYDDQGRLLQVQEGDRFFSIYRPHATGDAYSLLSDLALLPLTLRSRRLRRHTSPAGKELVRVRVLHPEAEIRIEKGIFSIRALDVFTLGIRDEFDLILSFNLLQRNYFPAVLVEEGLRNLTLALKEGGYLLTGNTESFGIAQKQNGVLQMLYREGEW